MHQQKPTYINIHTQKGDIDMSWCEMLLWDYIRDDEPSCVYPIIVMKEVKKENKQFVHYTDTRQSLIPR